MRVELEISGPNFAPTPLDLSPQWNEGGGGTRHRQVVMSTPRPMPKPSVRRLVSRQKHARPNGLHFSCRERLIGPFVRVIAAGLASVDRVHRGGLAVVTMDCHRGGHCGSPLRSVHRSPSLDRFSDRLTPHHVAREVPRCGVLRWCTETHPGNIRHFSGFGNPQSNTASSLLMMCSTCWV